MRVNLRRGNETESVKKGFSWTVLFFHVIALFVRKQFFTGLVFMVIQMTGWYLLQFQGLVKYSVTLAGKHVLITPLIFEVAVNIVFASIANQLRINKLMSKGFK